MHWDICSDEFQSMESFTLKLVHIIKFSHKAESAQQITFCSTDSTVEEPFYIEETRRGLQDAQLYSGPKPGWPHGSQTR